MLNVTVWNEFIHERSNPAVAEIYPDGLHVAIADAIVEQLGEGVHVRTATLDEPEHGLSEAVLAETDVLLWWGHAAHDRVDDAIVERVAARVLGGMGLVALHSAHASKIFCRMMGTSCMLRWREAGERERLWIIDPSHPLVDGIDREFFELPHAEMYGEHFDIPAPRRAGSCQLVRGRRSLPQPLHLPPRRRQDRLLQPRPRDVPHLPRQKHPQDSRQHRPLVRPHRQVLPRPRPQHPQAPLTNRRSDGVG